MKTKKIIKQLNKDIDKRIRKADRCGFSAKDLIKTILLLAFITMLIIAGVHYYSTAHAKVGTQCLAPDSLVGTQCLASDYYQQQGFTLEQIEEMEQQAKSEWKQTYGDIPPNLTEEQSQYLEKATALLQEKRFGLAKKENEKRY